MPFQVANLSANHRANDVIVIEGSEQVIHARFCYGPMDLVALSLVTVLGANYKLSKDIFLMCGGIITNCYSSYFLMWEFWNGMTINVDIIAPKILTDK